MPYIFIGLLIACCAAALILFFVTLHRNYNRNLLWLSLMVAMVINLFTLKHLTLLGFCLFFSIPLCAVYVIGTEILKARAKAGTADDGGNASGTKRKGK